MTKLEQIEKSITELSPEELKAFAAWFEALQADLWDRRIETEVRAGRLDKLAEQALADHRAGRTRPL
ncbi:iron-containing alcohol dehydrogenase [Mesorhizobium sp. B2-2-4]|uniref:iron-containing alcohol dehydrogenase n=1 Tax=unclassified Mesorhizobium TaxID=325217 RepID=UPI00112EF7F2|nr:MULTISPECIES: iron-containing alcohol dehydrogenase [unclassified Mesorhizobium]TPM53172.1 iron-containing alcohol dehydrogenase [Mesorhizobium sp. B2-2-4]TPM62186.1 iron-containing alcohol dehydrogenase [Mesorhizobium sp. B2-2-1]TPN68557.1 iron-containing alcohol dehydrogenase [Mesorhizobium sp. B1-1-3]